MKLPKPPKMPKVGKPQKVKPVKMAGPPKGVKPKLPQHMKGGQQGQPGPQNHPAGRQMLPAGALPPAPMGLPAPNTTADLYISPNAPPAAADQAAVAVHLEAEFEMATQHAQGDATFRWTHRMYVQDSTDIRDSWPNAPVNSAYIPTKNDTQFLIVFVEVVNRNTPQQYKRVFLYRKTPVWPTDNI